MAVLKFPSTSPKKAKRLSVTLTLVALPKAKRKKSAFLYRHFTGSVELNDFKFEADDGTALGVACFVMNVATLNVSSPQFPEGSLKLRASSANAPRELLYISSKTELQHAEEWFLKRAWTALKSGFGSKRQNRDVIERWNAELLPPVLALIPENLRVNTRLIPGIYDDNGYAITAHRLGQELNSRRFLDQFAKAMSGDTPEGAASNLQEMVDPEDLFNIPMDEITQLLDSANASPADPIVIRSAAFVPLKKLFSRFGIDDMPHTIGELRGALAYCEALHALAGGIKISPADDALWDKSAASTMAKYRPELLPSFLAYKAGDLNAMREVHRTRMTFAEMARHYDQERQEWLAPS